LIHPAACPIAIASPSEHGKGKGINFEISKECADSYTNSQRNKGDDCAIITTGVRSHPDGGPSSNAQIITPALAPGNAMAPASLKVAAPAPDLGYSDGEKKTSSDGGITLLLIPKYRLN